MTSGADASFLKKLRQNQESSMIPAVQAPVLMLVLSCTILLVVPSLYAAQQMSPVQGDQNCSAYACFDPADGMATLSVGMIRSPVTGSAVAQELWSMVCAGAGTTSGICEVIRVTFSSSEKRQSLLPLATRKSTAAGNLRIRRWTPAAGSLELEGVGSDSSFTLSVKFDEVGKYWRLASVIAKDLVASEKGIITVEWRNLPADREESIRLFFPGVSHQF